MMSKRLLAKEKLDKQYRNNMTQDVFRQCFSNDALYQSCLCHFGKLPLRDCVWSSYGQLSLSVRYVCDFLIVAKTLSWGCELIAIVLVSNS
eukprot:5126968-Amphidinium_carterae.1